MKHCKFKERLKELRLEKGLLQSELARIIGMSNSAISGWEIGRNQPNYELLILLAAFFETSVDYLIGYTDYPIGYTKI